MRVKRIFFSKSDPAKFWFRIMIVGLLLIYLWNAAFLYESGFKRWQAALFNSIFVSFVASLLSIFLGWFFSYYKYINEYLDKVVVSKTIIFFIDAIKSIPQVIGALTGYAILTNLTARDYNLSSFVLLILLSFILGLFLFVEAYDMFNERIAYYKDKDFISALRVLGMKESSIINKEILRYSKICFNFWRSFFLASKRRLYNFSWLNFKNKFSFSSSNSRKFACENRQQTGYFRHRYDFFKSILYF